MGFVPTMHKVRRGDSPQWLDEPHKLADERGVPVFPAIGDLASLASYGLDGHPYAPVAAAVEKGLSVVPRSSRVRRRDVDQIIVFDLQSLDSHRIARFGTWRST